MQVGTENIIVDFHRKQMGTKMLLCVTKPLFTPTFFKEV